ncbi:hypothetical protein [Streptomyces griseus]|uniref:hypothetical protein n=1 Tax=Streptomyces griseus TaxID=1911 RepID=UPI000AB95FFF|nr:hypothetical protein [Streptomyces griseus]
MELLHRAVVDGHVSRRRLEDLGADRFAVHAVHADREGTTDAYGTGVIPVINA